MAGPGTFDGPTRFLEWAKPIDLFLQYQAYAESFGQDSASLTSFLRVMRPLFKTYLKFRDKGEHGQCDICYKLRVKIRKASSRIAKNAATQMYTKRLLSQWLDRQCYWNLRSQSRNYFSQALHIARKLETSAIATSLVAIIQDGMDQAKLRVPRLGYNRPSKAYQKLFRPALHLVATFVHGFKLLINISDEDLKKDSVTSIELFCRSLCELVDTFGRFSLSIHLQQDNTYREGKNTYMVTFLLLLQILGIARFTSLGFLRVAHSHEDVDQCFGQISRLLMGKRCGSPNEMVATLQDAIDTRPDSNETTGRIRGSIAQVSKLDETSCWKPFVRQLGVKFKGLRHVHYIRFCRKRDLGPDVLDHVLQLEERSHRFPQHPDDIFLVTKKWLADKEVARAIMVVAADDAAAIRAGFHSPAGVAARKVIGEKIRKNLQKHIPRVQKTGEISAESAAYLRQWSSCSLPRIPKPNTYSVLGYRWDPQLQETHVEGSWETPHRLRHFDLTLDGEGGGESSDDSDSSGGEIDLPNGFDAE